MIVAAGLTPAWQQIMRFDHFRPGEVNRAKEVHWCASGKVLNVGIALGHLGAPSLTLALVGGLPAERIDREFASLGLRRRWITGHWSTRTCTTIVDESSGFITELVENAGPVTPAELEEFRLAFAQEAAVAKIVVLTGSLPAGAPAMLYRDLLASTSARAVLDIRGPELVHALEQKPFLVKPNREELGHTIGRTIATDGELRSAMQELNGRGAAWVVVSQGKDALWVTSQNECFRLTPPTAAVVNPIGSGDCLAAGIAWGLSSGITPLEAIRWGVAAATENVTQLLPARIDPVTVRHLAEQVAVEVLT